jgi:hypothetical protein
MDFHKLKIEKMDNQNHNKLVYALVSFVSTFLLVSLTTSYNDTYRVLFFRYYSFLLSSELILLLFCIITTLLLLLKSSKLKPRLGWFCLTIIFLVFLTLNGFMWISHFYLGFGPTVHTIKTYKNPFNSTKATVYLVDYSALDSSEYHISIASPLTPPRTLFLTTKCSKSPTLKWINADTLQIDYKRYNINQPITKKDVDYCIEIKAKKSPSHIRT